MFYIEMNAYTLDHNTGTVKYASLRTMIDYTAAKGGAPKMHVLILSPCVAVTFFSRRAG